MGKKLSILTVVILSLLMAASSVMANSAIRWWGGSDGHDSVVMTENCPVICQHEDLVFDIPESFQNESDFFQERRYEKSSVTATYTLYNPTDSPVDVRLAFPFGKPSNPSYGGLDDETLNLYKVLKNGEKLETILRYTISLGEFDLSSDVARLRDSYSTEGYFTEDLVIYKVTYKIEGSERDVGIIIPDDSAYTILCSGFKSLMRKDGKLTLTFHVPDGDTAITLYFCGRDSSDAEWNAAGVSVSSKKEMTFRQLVESMHYNKTVNDVDWFNLWSDYCNRYKDNNVIELPADITYYAMRWFEYSLHFSAGETLTNSVTAPLYPDIDSAYHPSIFTYHYLLSPASGWASFGDLDITVKTPDYLIRDNTFTKGDGQYTRHENSLPKGELAFTLCSVENPERPGDTYANIIIIFLLVSLALFIVLLIVIIKIIKRIIRKKKENRQ